MNDHQSVEDAKFRRRDFLRSTGVARAAGLADPTALTASAAAQDAQRTSATERNHGPLGARLQGVQHFGVTVQNMDRAFAFYTEVLGGPKSCATATFRVSV